MRTRIGPEVLTAASDNDPTNVGTAFLVGAQTNYQLSWMALLVAPLLGIVLTIAGRVGAATRNDLQSLILKRYGRRVARVVMVSVVLVNLVTIAADLQAGAAGIGLLANASSSWFVLPLGAFLVGLLLIGKYDEVVAVLRYMLVGFLGFGVAAVLAHPNWIQILRGSLIPTLSFRSTVLGAALALLGTTLTSYVYLWETISAGVETAPDSSADMPRQSRISTVIGSVFTAVILWFMLITSAATLGLHHRMVSTAQGAASALRPLAGGLAADIFAIGLITSAVVALPVLMATTAYVVGAEFDWRRGLSEKVSNARGFYAVLAASVALAAAVDLTGVSMLDMLFAASIIGGLGTPLTLVLLVRLARDKQVMGAHAISPRLATAGSVVAFGVGGLGLLYAITGLPGVL